MLDADIVVSFACRLRVSRQASPLKVAALLATVCCVHIDRVTYLCTQDKQRDRANFHDNPSLVFLLLISCSALALYARGFIDCGTQSESKLFGVDDQPLGHSLDSGWVAGQ